MRPAHTSRRMFRGFFIYRSGDLHSVQLAVTLLMVKILKYQATYGHRKTSVFSAAEQDLLKSLGSALDENRDASVQLAAFRSLLDNLSPYAYRGAASEIRDLVKLYTPHTWDPASYSWTPAEDNRREVLEHKFRQQTDLPFLFLFHGNGYNREQALLKLQGPLKSPIEVIALADLANNWVEQVRRAALVAINRTYPNTSPEDLAASFSFFAQNQKFWKRWDKQASKQVMSYFHTPDVVDALAKRFEEGTEPRGSRTLSYALQSENFDPHLERVFKVSKDASLRARALRVLLTGEATWATGYAWKWIDKSLGQRKRVTALRTRKLSIQPSKKPLLLAALADKSAQVRKIAAQDVIDHGKELDLPIADIARQLELDSSERVRRRGEYLTHKLQEDEVS